PKLRLCISAGAPLALAVRRQFQDKFNRPIHSFYGASECGGICYDRNAFPAVTGLVGQPMRGVDLEIIDPTASASQIRVRSAAVGEAGLLDFCRRGLSGWQVPKRVFIVDAIPANERGKISRRELARRFAAS